MVGSLVRINRAYQTNPALLAGQERRSERVAFFICAPKRPLGPCSPGLALHRIAAIDSGAVFSDPSAFTDDSGDKAHDDLFRFAYRRTSSRFPFSLLGLGLLLAGGFKTVERYHSCVLRRKPRDGQRLECRRFASADRFHQRFRRADFLSPGRLHLRLPGGRAGSRPLRGWAAGGQRDSRRCRRALGNQRFPLRLRRTLRYCRVQGLLGLRSSQPTSKGH